MGCVVLCFLIMQVPRFKNMKLAATVLVLVLGIGGMAVYTYFEAYTTVAEGQEAGEEQSSAIYRKNLAKNYAPILEGGGWLGYGAMSHPSAGGQDSIDNDYMLVQLSQGKFGLYVFYLIVFESIFSMIQVAVRFKSRETLFLVFCMMGAFAGLFASLKTVYLGEQVPDMLFLLLGWSQALQDTGPVGATADALPQPKFRFKRVIA